ncbi:nucleotide sugar dehydrogenase [Desertivirga xinjiangensis]|uniref:nucleotide sugar dehydrogenase n=1 Tax=Desertivirga xinjiangensis TaxID=539206 RepID=UPI00210C00C7|nr:nucleotide sugar dehydrogenase [Pedobacter xinjiangensis]
MSIESNFSNTFKPLQASRIAIIGLGYVGLPLAVAMSKKYRVTGFDINKVRVAELLEGHDSTLEVEDEDLKDVLVASSEALESRKTGFFPSADVSSIASCNIFIVTVPTPTDKHNRPVLTPMLKASETLGAVLKQGDVVIYESTVYPGVTEDECVPVLEKISGLKFNEDFYVGYSPERINPGDKEHTVTKILKVTSGSTPEAAEYIDQLYRSVITAGTFKASSIRVAEAAKVIENSQRDINIAFVNELAKIFNLLNIDTKEVLEAASTKWNFLTFKPGLVGGHCIGVDPYYLAQKAQEVGYHPEIILAGRRLNDSMGKHVAMELIKHMMRKNIKVMESKVLVLGFTFKENCPDIRNTKVISIVEELKAFDIDVDIHDPWADASEVKHEYGLEVLPGLQEPDLSQYSGIILAVAHKEFANLAIKKSDACVVYDVKGILAKDLVDARL